MKKKLRLKATLTALAIALALATTLPGATAQAKSKVAINKTTVTVCTGKSYTLKITGISKKVKWSTSNKNVVSITEKSGKKAEKVTIKGNKKGTATITAKVGKRKYKATVKVAGHKYGKVTYKWNKDYSKCTASKKCSRCGKTLKQTVKTSKKVTTKATCKQAGETKYTAKFTKYSFGTKNKNVSIKMKNHSVDSDLTHYTWKEGYSKCTARYLCEECLQWYEETVMVTKKTTPATKTSEGQDVYTATFKTKGLETQTQIVTIPKIIYTDKSKLSIRNDKPGTITLYNDTILAVDFGYYDIFYNPFYHDYQCGPDHITYTISPDGHTITISTKDPIGEESIPCSITTKNHKEISFDLTIEFVPGEYKIDYFRHCLQYPNENGEWEQNCGYYVPYGKYRGSLVEKSKAVYVVDCNTLADYKKACDTYEELEEKMINEENKKEELDNYFSNYSLELYYKYGTKPTTIITNNGFLYAEEQIYPDDGDVIKNYAQSFHDNSFSKDITSNAELFQIVQTWADMYNNGEMPSWYYYTVFSDWAEWSGRDIGMSFWYESSTGRITLPSLPDNYRD